MTSVRRTPAEAELETSLREAVETVCARTSEHDPQRIVPLERLADWYCARNEFAAAKPYLRDAVAIRIRSGGLRHPSLAGALNLLAKVAASEGKLPKAEEYLRHAVKCLTAAQPPRPVELADTWNHLAELRFRAGDVRQANSLCRKSRRELNGELDRHPLLALRLQNNQGVIQLSLNRPDRALRSFVRNLRLVRTLYPAEHPALITHYNNIAEALRRQGDARRAERYIRRALRISLRTWGWKHPVSAATSQHLAGARSLAGRWTSAAKLYERGYRVRRTLFPIHHPDVMKAALNAAECRMLLQEWSAAERLLEELRAALEQSPKSRRIPQAILQIRLARIYLATGRTATAERWLNEAWQEFEPQTADHPLFAAEIAAGLGTLHAQRSAHHRAADFFTQTLSLQEQALGPTHLDLARTLIDMGRNEAARSEPAQALACYERAVTIRDGALGPNHPLSAAARIHVAEIQCRLERWTDAAELGARAAAQLEQAPQPLPWLLAGALGVQAQAALGLSQPEQAEVHLTRELALREQASGPDHADIAPVLLSLGRLYKASERIEAAASALQRGLSIAERTRGRQDPAVIPFLAELCSLCATDGPTTELGPLAERYVKCHQRIYGNQSPELSQAQDQAAQWWRAAGDEARARELNEQAAALRELSTHVFGDLM